MALDSRHPQYSWFNQDWTMLRDVYKGSRAVKEAGKLYLAPTAGMILDGMGSGQIGYARFIAYRDRAVFYDFLSEGVEMLVGLLHQKAPTIELPADMENIRTRATPTGESLEALLRRINEEQLITGRCGLMADLPSTPSMDPKSLPYIALYTAESIVNWDDDNQDLTTDKLTLVILYEAGYSRDAEYTWTDVKHYRILEMTGNIYRQGLFEESAMLDVTKMTTPQVRGRTLDQLPFVFINSKDIIPTPDRPPLMGLANMALHIYRSDADYRQSLHMQGQDTLIIVGSVRNPDATAGENDAIRTGAGSRIDIDVGGDAKYIGVSPNGLPEQRFALENDKKLASNKAGQLVQTSAGNRESGDALRTRLAAQTATLNQIALSSAAGLEQVLKIIAIWKGSDPDKVKVRPNLEFTDFDLAGDEFLKLMTARQMGAPISKESIHSVMRERGLTRMEYTDEVELIEKEDALNPPLLPAPSGPQRAASGQPPKLPTDPPST